MAGLFFIAEQIGSTLVSEIKEQIVLQGHRLTGTLAKSVSYDVISDPVGVVIRFYMESYGLPLNAGIVPNRIPFGRVTKAKVSKYIQGLKNFAKQRFRVTERQALGIAFAIAHKHAREGMPTFASFQFSKTRERTGFVEDAIKNQMPMIEKYISELETELIAA